MLDDVTILNICGQVVKRYPTLDPEDTYQDVWIQLAKEQPDDEALAWTIAKTTCVDLIRKATVRSTIPLDLIPEVPGASQHTRDPQGYIPALLDLQTFLEVCGEPVQASLTRKIWGYPPDATQSLKDRDRQRIHRARKAHGWLLKATP